VRAAERRKLRGGASEQTFERIDHSLHDLREEMHAGFAALRSDLAALQRQVTHILAGFAIALLGVVAAGLAAAITDAF
jgi:hypothetical protein